VKIFAGGFESNEEYTYVRGRGRGKYVCEECGIRCKKPSMLKKHIRTHTDVRPFTCKHCSFSFKTKGNLTKHMKSKAHYKKCMEMGIVPVPTVVDESNIDEESLLRQVRALPFCCKGWSLMGCEISASASGREGRWTRVGNGRG
jgi:Zinc finger, C2H2 type